jgi:predicted dehydrogenase
MAPFRVGKITAALLAFVHAAIDFLDACATGGSVEPNFRDGVKSLKVLEAAAASMESGRRVEIG